MVRSTRGATRRDGNGGVTHDDEAELLAKAGTHFAPACVNAVLTLRSQVEAIHLQREPSSIPPAH